MFELLTRYLLEYKKLPVPQTGIFELEKKMLMPICPLKQL